MPLFGKRIWSHQLRVDADDMDKAALKDISNDPARCSPGVTEPLQDDAWHRAVGYNP